MAAATSRCRGGQVGRSNPEFGAATIDLESSRSGQLRRSAV